MIAEERIEGSGEQNPPDPSIALSSVAYGQT